MPEAGELTGKVALVTGGSAGIGRAICHKLARLGAAVAVMARREEAVAKVVSEIEAEGGRGLAVVCDVTDYAAEPHRVQWRLSCLSPASSPGTSPR